MSLSSIYKFLILFIFFVTSHHAWSFINVESVRKIEGKGFIGRSALQTSGQMGNTEKFTSQFTTIGAWRLDQNEWLYSGNYKYGTSAKKKDTNTGIAHLRHTWGYENKLAYEAFVQSEFNEFKELNSRHYIGGNLRFRLLTEDYYYLYLGVGAFYELEDFHRYDRDRNHLRANTYLSYLQNFNKTISSFITIYYQPLFRELHNHRVRVLTGLDVKLNSKLSLGVSFNINHDAGVPKGVKTTDMDYLVGFALSY
ncbi:MAG TPA: DUF481 domain-containing protein [Bacteriovoracaceae bacterium]|nr:DUF481 domain-containing protein [Bacteriovoracaceae bacterium]